MSVMPLLRRSVVEPLWVRARGSPLLAAGRELEASQYLSARTLREMQSRRLVEMVRFAHASNAFWRERFDRYGIDPSRVGSPEDLGRLPLLTKREVRAAGTSILSAGFDPASLMQFKTGGSTGVSLDLYATEHVSELRNACARRHKRWTGWKVGEPIAAVWGNAKPVSGLRDRLREVLFAPMICLDTMSVTPESVGRFAEDWRRVRPTLVFGHAHSIFVLAEMVRELGLVDVRPRGIVASSMMLLPHERAVIEEVFGVRVFDFYGCEEVGLIGAECERHEGMHLNVDQVLVELVREDGTPAASGEPALVVVTDLINRAMPLFRYRMEDVAAPMPGICACGREMPRMGRLVGRVADFLVRRDGSRVAGVSLIENSLTRIPGIEQMQIVQEALDRIVLRLVADPHFTVERHAEVVAYFDAEFPGARVEVERVGAIAPEPNGKFRFSICRLSTGGGPASPPAVVPSEEHPPCR